jgi:hypothetical protein
MKNGGSESSITVTERFSVFFAARCEVFPPRPVVDSVQCSLNAKHASRCCEQCDVFSWEFRLQAVFEVETA